MNNGYRANSRMASFIGALCSCVALAFAPPFVSAQTSAAAHISTERSFMEFGALFIRSPFTQNPGPYELYSLSIGLQSERTLMQFTVLTLHPTRRADHAPAGYFVAGPILNFSYSVYFDRAHDASAFFDVGYSPIYAYGFLGNPTAEKAFLARWIPITAGLHVGPLSFGVYFSDTAPTAAGRRFGIERSHVGVFLGTRIKF